MSDSLELYIISILGSPHRCLPQSGWYCHTKPWICEYCGIGSNDATALLCHTNFPPPPGSAISGGDWWAPDGTRVTGVFGTDVTGVTRNRGAMVVRLRRTSGDPPEGIYRCTIDDAASTVQMVYVGLYNTGGGI